jgi:hypothetical protein
MDTANGNAQGVSINGLIRDSPQRVTAPKFESRELQASVAMNGAH